MPFVRGFVRPGQGRAPTKTSGIHHHAWFFGRTKKAVEAALVLAALEELEEAHRINPHLPGTRSKVEEVREKLGG